MDELLTIVLTTVIAFMVTKLCQVGYDKIHNKGKSREKKNHSRRSGK